MGLVNFVVLAPRYAITGESAEDEDALETFNEDGSTGMSAEALEVFSVADSTGESAEDVDALEAFNEDDSMEEGGDALEEILSLDAEPRGFTQSEFEGEIRAEWAL